jgi:predicted  nucleic acid-binding Zn-ribbon protein
MEDCNKGSLQYGTLKGEVAETLVKLTTPFKENLAAINSNKENVKAQIYESSAEIRKVAQQTNREVKELMGIMNPKN